MASTPTINTTRAFMLRLMGSIAGRGYLTFTCAVFLLTLGSSAVYALPNDALIRASGTAGAQQTVDVSVGYETVGDMVSYAPNLDNGDTAHPTQKTRFEGFTVGASGWLTPRLSWHGGFNRQSITTRRDNYLLNLGVATVQYHLPMMMRDVDVGIRFGVGSNYASSFYKNSYTSFGDTFLKSLEVRDPSDVQIQSNILVTKRQSAGLLVTGFAGIGAIKTTYGDVSAIGSRDDNCEYALNITNTGSSVTQLSQCGKTVKAQQRYPNHDALESNLGVHPGWDMANQSSYWQLGANVSYENARLTLQAGYYFQQSNRGILDRRIINRGETALTNSHTLTLQSKYRLSRRLSLTAALNYNSQQLLTRVPVLYTGFTGNRFDEDIVYVTLRMNVHFRR